ncbi:DUF1206 domain-containing protein [Phenylobacterium sp. VNQ135]|uniref:DUF1206 domain-containing protein n=1 Tax=Phenylobacterium sp. VNQ135 TaxID=3400922 RepID=UPI003BFF2AFB
MVDAPALRLGRRFERRPVAALIELAARAGYLARGAVHVSIGAIALLAALDVTPRAEGVAGAMDAWREWPAGIVLLWLIGLGLYAFAGWRALQAVFDVDGQGRKPKALLARLGQAVSGAVYAGMAVSVFGLLDAIEDLGETDDQAKTRAFVARMLDLPMGGWLVAGTGLFVAGCGVGSIARALLDHFGRDLQGDRDTRRWAVALARIGYLGRGVALLPAGLFLVVAGLHARASEARGLGGALDALERQPLGTPFLSLTALGLIAFGFFAVAEGWLRPMRPERALD